MDSKTLKYILKRFFLSFLTIFLIITITFFIMHAVPSSPFSKEKALTESVRKALEAKFGLDKPLLQQYTIYLKNAIQLDFGESIHYKGWSVIELIMTGFKTSMLVGIIAAGLALTLGVILGSLAAIKRESLIDKVILVVTTASVSLPAFVVAIVLLYVFGVMWRIFPTRGDTAAGLIMPIISLMAYPCAYVTKLTRSSMLDVLGQDYIRTAHAKGVMPRKVLFKHALKNALTPVITYAGPMIAYVVTGSIVVEQIFSIAGLGQYFVTSIINSDYTMIMGTTIFLSVIMVGMTFLCDILYKVIDKRIDFS